MSYTVEDMRREIANLYMEAKTRAQREQVMAERIAELEAEIEKLRNTSDG